MPTHLRRSILLSVALGACATADTPGDGFRSLFDGESLDGWRAYDAPTPPDGWRAEDGTLHRYGPGGDIMTVEEFEDFDLRLSGIFYLAQPGAERIYESAPEMQVLDDERHPDGGSPLTSAGSNYGLDPAPRGVVRPAGEWNEARIVKRGDHVEHWLNGEKIVEYELGSEEWNEKVAASKFAEWPEYGTARRGHIGLQDHGDPVWFRNIRIRVLEGGES